MTRNWTLGNERSEIRDHKSENSKIAAKCKNFGIRFSSPLKSGKSEIRNPTLCPDLQSEIRLWAQTSNRKRWHWLWTIRHLRGEGGGGAVGNFFSALFFFRAKHFAGYFFRKYKLARPFFMVSDPHFVIFLVLLQEINTFW